MSDKIDLSDEEWKKKLSPESYKVCRKKGTEKPFSGNYWNSEEKGTYVCIACNLPLFKSDDKYDSGTGWPSFFSPIEGNVEGREDNSFSMKRTEVICSRCGSHLGHVFDDGPKPTGKRFCINSAALKFEP